MIYAFFSRMRYHSIVHVLNVNFFAVVSACNGPGLAGNDAWCVITLQRERDVRVDKSDLMTKRNVHFTSL
jgi:hypothetical protein